MFFIFVISMIIYIVATVIIYHSIYNFDKASKIKFIIIGFAVTIIVSIVVCNISSSDINTNNDYLSIAKNTSILLFAPINAIISLPYIGNLLNKYIEKKLTEEQIKKRGIIFLILLVFVIAFEVGYIKDFEVSLIRSAIKI